MEPLAACMLLGLHVCSWAACMPRSANSLLFERQDVHDLGDQLGADHVASRIYAGHAAALGGGCMWGEGGEAAAHERRGSAEAAKRTDASCCKRAWVPVMPTCMHSCMHACVHAVSPWLSCWSLAGCACLYFQFETSLATCIAARSARPTPMALVSTWGWGWEVHAWVHAAPGQRVQLGGSCMGAPWRRPAQHASGRAHACGGWARSPGPLCLTARPWPAPAP